MNYSPSWSLRPQNHTGFTLIEVLLVITLITIVLGLSAPVVRQFQLREQVNVGVSNVALQWRRAALLARHQSENSAWGVAVIGDEAILYRGDSYASRDASYDEALDITAQDQSLSGGASDLNFSPLDGYPDADAGVTLSNGGSYEKSVSINQIGVVEYQ